LAQREQGINKYHPTCAEKYITHRQFTGYSPKGA